jgi:hypothetical protein
LLGQKIPIEETLHHTSKKINNLSLNLQNYDPSKDAAASISMVIARKREFRYVFSLVVIEDALKH